MNYKALTAQEREYLASAFEWMLVSIKNLSQQQRQFYEGSLKRIEETKNGSSKGTTKQDS